MIEMSPFGFSRQDKDEYIMVTFQHAAYVLRKPPSSLMVLYVLNTHQIQGLYYRAIAGGHVHLLDEPHIIAPFIPLIKPTLEADPLLWVQLRELLERLNVPHAN